MGVYFNPCNDGFRKDSQSRIYIDKTGLLEELNQILYSSENCVALSHARRFGKSQAARMIDAYYGIKNDSGHLFEGYEIAGKADYKTHLNKYNVIHLDISSFTDTYGTETVRNIWRLLYMELKEQYPELPDATDPVGSTLLHVYEKSGVAFVIIIDEWDCVIRNYSDHSEFIHEYLQFLHAIFKSEESVRYLALGYITGILPIKKIKDESALNNFWEYTMLESRRFTRYFGFTEDEVKDLCKKYRMDFDSVKEWYDGYLINGIHMYNPNSVYQSMINHSLESYWKNTSAFDTLNTFISLNFDGLKEDVLEMLSGKKVVVNTDTFKNDLSIILSKDDALTALIHLGYLAYDKNRHQAYIPNFEVASAFQTAVVTCLQ